MGGVDVARFEKAQAEFAGFPGQIHAQAAGFDHKHLVAGVAGAGQQIALGVIARDKTGQPAAGLFGLGQGGQIKGVGEGRVHALG